MKNSYKLLLILICLFAPLFVFAQVTPPSIDELTAFLSQIGGLKGASALAIAGVAVQGVILAVRTPFAKLSGGVKLMIITGLTLVASYLAKKALGLPDASILFDTTFLASVQVFINQIINQDWKKA